MTFEQAGAEYARLQAEWRAGRMAPQEYQARAAQLRVADASGRWWQIDPASGQWLYWSGQAWTPVAPPPAPAPMGYAAAPAPARAPAAAPAPSGPGIMEGLMSVAPGLLVEFLQRGPYYRQNPQAALQFGIPALLPAVALALAPKLGRVFAVMVIVGCLGWLAWPLIAGAPQPAGGTNPVMAQAGRGLVGMSMLYMIPRIWTAARR